jgi:acetyl/propionyl-CoA carboxylase alpha subunit
VASCRAPRSNRPVRYVGRRTALKKLLVANRGEIAVRVMRSAREIGLLTVAVYSESDRDALHVAYADEAFLLGPASPSLSYLNVEKLLDVAARSGADAVHPGYGFLAENAGFARAVIAAGLTWVGPHPDAIDAMGDKIRSRQAMVAAGVPVVPGATTPLRSADDAIAAAKEYGLPIALKASGGGGGKGLKIARTLEEVPSAFATAEREAEAYFKNPIVYVERYLDNPKHVELQILADKHGNVVHVGERDCSLQRRHQKLYEETPALVSEAVRERLREAGIKAARAGTTISADYDSMIAKLIVWAPTRVAAQARLNRAIDEYRIAGVPTTLGFLRALNGTEAVKSGNYGTATLEAFATTWSPAAADAAAPEAAAEAAPPADDVVRVEVDGKLFRVRLLDRPAAGSAGGTGPALAPPPKRTGPRASNGRAPSGNDVVSPMHGAIVELSVKAGDDVAEGQVVAVIEAMKMMNEIRAHRAGSVATVHVQKGTTVEAFAPLVTLA